LKRDAVLTSASGRGSLLTRPQSTGDNQQAEHCDRRSADCQWYLPHKKRSGSKVAAGGFK
jgi:hypothetical protein